MVFCGKKNHSGILPRFCHKTFGLLYKIWLQGKIKKACKSLNLQALYEILRVFIKFEKLPFFAF
jgi:hypothetical protein